VLQIVASAKRLSAPLALAVATAEGKLLGLTKYKRDKAMFFIALAPAPILPGSVVLTMTILTLSKGVKV
jgi:hypothetical protein